MPRRRKSLRQCIRAFSPAWFSIIMGTGSVSVLVARFHFGAGSLSLKVISLIFFFLNLVFFAVFLAASIARYAMFPELWKRMLLNPEEGLFVGAFPIGAANLIDECLILNQNWSFRGNGLMFSLWGFWWLVLGISYITAFGMIYTMMLTRYHLITETTSVWVLPIIPLIVLSATGGNLAYVLHRHHWTTLATLTVGFSLNAFAIGMSLTLMIATLFLTRLITRGPPKAHITPAGFIIVSPLGQGGYSLLSNGRTLERIFSRQSGDAFSRSALSGEMLYSVCVCGAWMLWSMGIAWIVISLSEIYVTASRRDRIPFTLAYWGLVFPNGVFAVCSVQLGVVFDSKFFHYFGAIWSCMVLVLWFFCFIPTVIYTWDTSIFEETTPPQIHITPELTPTISNSRSLSLLAERSE